jgi:undecaprenyl-diphosphatase
MIYAVLGIIQGLTEFLPVSSSGHLVLLSWFFDIEKSQILSVAIVCHIGTLFAMLCFFARDIWKILKELRIIGHIFIVSLVTSVFVLLNRAFFERLFENPLVVCWALLVTAIFLILTRRYAKGAKDLPALNIKDALWLGVAQGFTVIPGLSRAGITIFTLLARRFKPETAFRFSMIAGMPAIAGAFILEAKGIGFIFNHYRLNFWAAFGASFLFSLLGLYILKRMVKGAKLHYFAYYLVPVSILGFMFIK